MPTKKIQCEICTKEHDGTFGAGRFCSSRCARTVGGIAHKKKRLRERGIPYDKNGNVIENVGETGVRTRNSCGPECCETCAGFQREVQAMSTLLMMPNMGASQGGQEGHPGL